MSPCARRACIALSLIVLLSACHGISEKRVDSTNPSTLTCTPGMVQCNATLDAVEQCRPEGYGFLQKESCANGCNAGTASCNSVCRPGTTSCSENELQTCKADGSGWDSTTCANGCDASKGLCFGSCTPGSTVCNGDVLETCSSDGGGYTQTACKHGCDASSTVQACYESCRPGSQTCDADGNLGTCNGAGTGYDTTPCVNGCDPTTLACFGELTADAGANQVIVLGDEATLVATATGGDGNYTYSWSDGSGPIGTHPLITVEPGQTTVYTVTITDGEGNSDTAQVTVTVESRLTADAGADRSILRGQDVTLVGTASGGIGDKSCSWSLDGKQVSSECSYTVAPVKDGSFVLTVSDSQGHTAQDSVEVRVYDPLAVVVSAADPKLFAGESTTLALGVTGGVPPLASCVWDDPSGSDNCDGIKVTLSATTTFTVVVTDANGNTATGSVTVEVVTLSAQGPDELRVCQVAGFELLAVGQALGGVEPTRCEWWGIGPNGLVKDADSCSANTTYPGVPSSDGTAELRVFDAKGHSQTKTVDVKVADPIAFVTKQATFDIVVGESVRFNANDVTDGGFGDTRSCEYLDMDGNVVASGCVDILWFPAATQTYTLNVSDGTCPTGSLAIDVVVHAVPTLSAINDVHVGYGADATITYSVSNTHPDAVCLLRKKGESVTTTIPCADGTNSYTLANQSETTEYEVLLVIGATSHAIQGFTVTVLKATANAEPNAIVGGDETTLSASVVGDLGALTCQWRIKGQASFFAENDCVASVTHKPATDVVYEVVVTDSDDVSTTAEVAVSVGLVVDPITDLYVEISQANVPVTGSWVGGTAPYVCTWRDETNGVELKTGACTGFSDGIGLPQLEPTLYSLTVSDANNKSDKKTFTIHVLRAVANANPATIQPSGSSSLTVGISGAKGTNWSCVWTDGSGSVVPGDCGGATVSPAVTTSYLVTVTDNDTGNKATANVSVAVELVLQTPTDVYTQAGTSTTVTGTWQGGEAAMSCTWTDQATGAVLKTGSCSGTSDSLTTTVAANATVRLTVKYDSDGTSKSGDIKIHVLKAEAKAEPASSGQAGTTITLTGTATDYDPGQAVSCVFTNNRDATTLNGCVVSVTPTIDTTYTVTITNAGHSATAQVTVPVKLLVQALPDLYVGQTPSFNVTGTWSGGNPGYQCRWIDESSGANVKGPGPCTNGSDVVALTPATTREFTFEVTDSDGGGTLASVTFTVNVLAVTATADKTYVASGARVTLGVTPSGQNPASTYSCTWTDNLGGAPITNDCAPVVIPTETVTYSVTYSNGSESATSSITISVLTVEAGMAQTVPRGASVTLTATATGNQGSGSCVWTNNVTADSLNGCTVSFPALVKATWTVTYTDTNGNVASDTVDVSITDPCADGTTNGNESDKDCGGPTVWFNEIHYDNASTDADEGFELAGPLGLDLTGWKVLLISSAGAVTATFDLSTFANRVLDNGNPADKVGVRWFGLAVNALPNSTFPRGLMLVDAFDRVHQFLSYGNSTVITSTYAGTTVNSTPIGLNESGSTPLGASLQLVGTGNHYHDFTWVKDIASTHDAVNAGQTFAPLPGLSSPNICGRCDLNRVCGGLTQSCNLATSPSYECSPTFDVCFDCSIKSDDFQDASFPTTATCDYLGDLFPLYKRGQVRITSSSAGPYAMACGAGHGWTSTYLGIYDPVGKDIYIRFPYPVTGISFTLGQLLNYTGVTSVELYLPGPSGPTLHDSIGIAATPSSIAVVPAGPVDWIMLRAVGGAPNPGFGLDDLSYDGPLCP
ncbi:MAG: PKD domain-containing protein [Myxococcales bacterium]|nr:PKD domain-containing protein [Myxococcales bacterium]